MNYELANNLFSYNSDTGEITYKKTRNSSAIAGKKCPLRVSVGSEQIYAHRLAWLLFYKTSPELYIDHINGDPTDNRIANLRDVDFQTNCENKRRPNSDNTTGFLGVSKYNNGKFLATIRKNNRNVHIGYFDTPEEAHQKYIETKRKLHEGCTI